MAEEYVWMTEWVLFYYNNFYVPCISKQTSSVFGWQYVDERATKGSGRFHSNQRDYEKDMYLISYAIWPYGPLTEVRGRLPVNLTKLCFMSQQTI